MGRKLASVILLICFGTSLAVFWGRDHKGLRESIDLKGNDHRIRLENFTAMNYEDGQLVSKLSAKLGRFIEPNMMELEGEVHAEKYSETEVNGVPSIAKESMRSDQATIYLRAASLSTLMNQEADLDRAELTGFVHVGVKDHVLTTDYAEYIQKENVVRSPKQVQINGPQRFFEGEEGFIYSLSSQVLEMKGKVKGVSTVEKKAP